MEVHVSACATKQHLHGAFAISYTSNKSGDQAEEGGRPEYGQNRFKIRDEETTVVLPESVASSAISLMSLHLKATEKDATAMLVQGQQHSSYSAPVAALILPPR